MKTLIITLLITLCGLVHAQDSLYMVATQELQAGSYQKALDHYKEAGSSFLKAGDSEMYSSCKLGEVECYLGMGDIKLARSMAVGSEKYISVAMKSNKGLLAKSKMLAGDAYLRSGRNDLALEQLKEAEDLLDEDSEEAAACFDDLGVIYTNNGNRELALQYLEKALDIRMQKKENEIAIADSYNNIGRVYLEDEPLQAIIYFNRALKIYTDSYGKSHPKVAICYSNIAFANANQNNFNDAMTYLKEVEDIYSQIYSGPHPNKAFTFNNQGRIMEMRGDYDAALRFQNQALNMYLELYGNSHPEVANTYFLIGSVHQKKGEYKTAATLFQKSIYANLYDQTFESIYDLPEIRDYYNGDILLSSLQSKAKALEAQHYSQSLKLKDIDGALQTLKKCDELITQLRQLRFNEADKLRLAKIASEVYGNGISIATYLSDRTFRKNYYINQAFDFCERSKSAILLSAINDTKAKHFAGIPDRELANEDSLKSEIGFLEQQLAQSESDEEIQNLKASLLKYQTALQDFISKLESDYPEYYKLKYNNDLASIQDIQRTLDSETAVLSYFISDTRIYIFEITENKKKIFNYPQGDHFSKMSSGFRNSIRYQVGKTFTQTSHELYNQLIPKIPGNINKLIIIPAPEISTIPFEALVVEPNEFDMKENLYLIEKYSVGYDYAATLMVDRQGNKSKDIKGGILLAAPVSFQQNKTPLNALPGSKIEVQEIDHLFAHTSQKVTAVLEKLATEKLMKSNDLSQYQYIHLATHGVVNESKPELSRVFLTPGQEEDGSLFSGEIYNLKIDAELVTLSACETGLGKIAKGEGIVGLSRALQYAGARNLIVSFWQVADASTARLMIEFYKQHLNHQNISSFANDLRLAKLDLLRSDEYFNPYYWAPFILIGQ